MGGMTHRPIVRAFAADEGTAIGVIVRHADGTTSARKLRFSRIAAMLEPLAQPSDETLNYPGSADGYGCPTVVRTTG